jgi:hypothetical protein
VQKILSSKAHLDPFAVECDAPGPVAADRFPRPMIVLAETSHAELLGTLPLETAPDKARLSKRCFNFEKRHSIHTDRLFQFEHGGSIANGSSKLRLQVPLALLPLFDTAEIYYTFGHNLLARDGNFYLVSGFGGDNQMGRSLPSLGQEQLGNSSPLIQKAATFLMEVLSKLLTAICMEQP